MPKLKFLVFSESWSVDEDTGNLSIFNIIQNLHPQKFPARLNKLVGIADIAFSVEDIGQDFQLSLEVVMPNKQAVKRFINMKPEKHSHLAIMRLRGLPFREPGDVLFQLKLNGEILSETIITVHSPAEDPENDGDLFRYTTSVQKLPNDGESSK